MNSKLARLRPLVLIEAALLVCGASLRAQIPPTISVQPLSQRVIAGGSLTLEVVAGGSGPFIYQWQINGTNLPNGIITTVAGNGAFGYSGDGGPVTNASLSTVTNLIVDAAGNLFLADGGNRRVRKVDANGIITTVAGNGTRGYSGDGGLATDASLSAGGVAVGATGCLFIADAGRIRKVIFIGMPTLTLSDVRVANAGDYRVIITTSSGSLTSAVASVTVASPALRATLEPGPAVRLHFTGTAGSSYSLQAATALTSAAPWQTLVTNTADANGHWSYLDTNAVALPARFYRASEHP